LGRPWASLLWGVVGTVWVGLGSGEVVVDGPFGAGPGVFGFPDARSLHPAVRCLLGAGWRCRLRGGFYGRCALLRGGVRGRFRLAPFGFRFVVAARFVVSPFRGRGGPYLVTERRLPRLVAASAVAGGAGGLPCLVLLAPVRVPVCEDAVPSIAPPLAPLTGSGRLCVVRGLGEVGLLRRPLPEDGLRGHVFPVPRDCQGHGRWTPGPHHGSRGVRDQVRLGAHRRNDAGETAGPSDATGGRDDSGPGQRPEGVPRWGAPLPPCRGETTQEATDIQPGSKWEKRETRGRPRAPYNGCTTNKTSTA